MNRSDLDKEIDAIERHAWRVWLENGSAIVCRRCGNPFVPAGGRRGGDGGEPAAGDGETTRGDGETVPEYGESVQGHGESGAGGNDRPVDKGDDIVTEHDNAVDLCGSCLPLRLLQYGDRSKRLPECVVCGGPIRGRRSGSLYCGDSCKKQGYRLRKRGNAESAQDDDETEDVGGDIGPDAKGGQTTSEGGSTT